MRRFVYILVGLFGIAMSALPVFAFDPTYRNLTLRLDSTGTSLAIINNTLGFTPTITYIDTGIFEVDYSGHSLNDNAKKIWTAACGSQNNYAMIAVVEDNYFGAEQARISSIPANDPIIADVPTAPDSPQSCYFDFKYYDGSQVDPALVPAGGTTGQILSKVNGTDYNTQWVDAPTGTGGSSSTTMVTDWPDAIKCTWWSGSAVTSTRIYYASVMPDAGDFSLTGEYMYNSLGNSNLWFNADGTIDTTNTEASLTGGSCAGKTIAQLYTDNQAYNFVGGGTGTLAANTFTKGDYYIVGTGMVGVGFLALDFLRKVFVGV